MIESIKIFDEDDSKFLAEIKLLHGETQRPTKRGLARYTGWDFVSGCDLYITHSATGEFAAFGMSVAGGQGGISAVWHSRCKRWEHVSECEYIASSLLLDDVPVLLTLSYVSNYLQGGYHSIDAHKLDRTRCSGTNCLKNIKAEHSHGCAPSDLSEVSQFAYAAHASPHPKGATGIYRLRDRESFIAHDAGNLYQFKFHDIINALDVES